MKKYTFGITIDEGQDEFWESIQGMSGCDEVEEVVSNALADCGFDLKITLVLFQDTTPNKSNEADRRQSGAVTGF